MASAALTVTEMRSAKAKIHSAVPPVTPSMSGVFTGGAILKWALTMERNSFGALSFGTRSHATQGGVASTTVSSGNSGIVASGNSSATAWLVSKTIFLRRCPNRTSASRPARYASAGSTKAADSVGCAIRGR